MKCYLIGMVEFSSCTCTMSEHELGDGMETAVETLKLKLDWLHYEISENH